MTGLWLTCAATPAAQAEIYLFRVDCPDGAYVARWETSAPDPGKYSFRIATGNANLDCSVYDYNAKTDRDLPQRLCSIPDSIIRGFPPLMILLGYTHCS
jgi:hypothetical protein